MWESARNITSGCSAVPAWTACSPLHASTSPTRSATCSPRFGLAQATSCLSAGPPRRAWRSVDVRIGGGGGTLLGDRGKPGGGGVRMRWVCAGYRAVDEKPSDPPHQPEERFRPDGWFATGDEYLQDTDGFYHHRGRTGDMLRVSGIWISPAEIEDVLAGVRSISETAAVLGDSEIGLAEIRLD